MAALQDFAKLPDTAGVRLPTVCALLGVGPATIWRWAKAGLIPAPVKLSPRVTAWPVGQLREHMRKVGLA